MKRYIVAAGILATALLTGGCGKFVRDELITMQNEIDRLYGQVEQMNQGLATLRGIVDGMAAGGYIVDVKEVQDEGRNGYSLVFRTVTLDENGAIVTEDTFSISLFSGKDGQDGQDAQPVVVSVKQDEEDGRWYWYSTQDGDWLRDGSGGRFLVDGKDGRTPKLKVEEGLWCISWDNGETWEATGWKAKGEDAFAPFSKAEVFEDRVELTLASDGSVLVLPRFLPVGMDLTLNGQPLAEALLIAPGETLSIRYVLTGTGAESAHLFAGTDGRFKTGLREESATEGVVDVTCPDEFPEGGYVYVTVNDGNGRSEVRVIRFARRTLKLLFGEADYAAKADEETGRMLTFEANCELEASCIFPEGVEPWLTAKMEVTENVPVLTYDIAANASTEARTGVIIVSPKDHPGFELFRVTVTQAGKPAETGSGQ